ncbi:MAG: 3-phosphoshikimate 1-carboxyvinyltransferase [Chloroflexi bacterium]|nr:3-phosphoshikimate 1-carboxyvinyltransferase [Chloroflexota bacterium]
MNLHVVRSRALTGEVGVPGDKSITHRALLLGALSSSNVYIRNYLDSADCLATLGCLRALGVQIARRQAEVVVHGRGMHGWREPADVLDCIRSGTTMRLLSGLLAGQPFMSVLSGRAQLRARPMSRIIMPLQQMGAHISGRAANRLPPLCIQGSKLSGIHYRSPIASAQVSSSILLAGLYAEGITTIIEPERSRDHTVRMLRARGVPVAVEGASQSLVGPVASLDALDVCIPGDISSAAFFLVAGLLVPGSSLGLKSVGVNPTRTGLLDALQGMGVQIVLQNERDEGGEPVADILVHHQDLHGVTVGGSMIPRMIDEIPILALAATQAEGETIIRDVGELRVKETDRIATIVGVLRAMGARIEASEDSLIIQGPTPLHGAFINSEGDHRIAMMAAVAGLIAAGDTFVSHLERIQDSFPGFVPKLVALAPGAVQ